MRKKLAIIGIVGIPANYGGFETLAEHLAEDLSEQMDITVYCSGIKYKKPNRAGRHKGAKLYYLPFKANGFQSIIYDCISMLHALLYADVLLVLGVPGGFLIPFVRAFTNVKIITSVDGIEWKRDKWSIPARKFLWASEWLAVKFSHASIADNEAIQDYTAMRYGLLSSIIEYGADHVLHTVPTQDDIAAYPFLARPYAVKVCRIEPENNIHLVLEAFARLNRYTLVIVGNWQNSAYGTDLYNRYHSYSNMHLLDPVYDARKIGLLRCTATVYIHGHSAGGTNPSLVEAMFLGLPVIAFNVMYNRATTEEQAMYFSNADELTEIISSIPIRQLKSIGQHMKAIADRRYTWQVISGKYAALIHTVLEARRSPSLNSRITRNIPADALHDIGIYHLQTAKAFYEK